MDLMGLYPCKTLMSHHCSANTKITTHKAFSYVCHATTVIKQKLIYILNVSKSNLFRADNSSITRLRDPYTGLPTYSDTG